MQKSEKENKNGQGCLSGCGCLCACIFALCLFAEQDFMVVGGMMGLALCVVLFLIDYYKTQKHKTSNKQTPDGQTPNLWTVTLDGNNGNAKITITDSEGTTQILNELHTNGALTQGEFESGKSFWGASKNKAQQTLETLAKLHQLMKQGAISESEYNIKKWELLAEKLDK